MLCGPWRHDRFHAMLGRSAATKTGDTLGDELYSVEMLPSSLVSMVGSPAGSSALRAGNARADMSEANPDPPLIDLVDVAAAVSWHEALFGTPTITGGSGNFVIQYSAVPVPEPATLVLLAGGALAGRRILAARPGRGGAARP